MHYGAEVESVFTGELWTCSRELDGVNFIEAVDGPGLCTKPGRIHSGGNTGYGLINLAYAWGARRIVLLGYDMQPGPKGELHHHGRHGGGLPNPLPENFKEWRQRLIELGRDLRAQGVEVINATRRTAVTCFEQLPIDVVLRDDRVAMRTASVTIPQRLLPREREAFEKGLSAAGYRIVEDDADVSVIWGTQKRPKGRVLVAENGYVKPLEYCAIGVDGHNGAGEKQRGRPDRLEQLGVELKPWRTQGDHVLVCPSRGIGAGDMRQPDGWLDSVVTELRRHTKRVIRIRPHPGNWKVSAPLTPLERDLKNAWACVIWASTAGIAALREGVPVIQTAPHWICEDAAGRDLAQIEAPVMPDRMPAFERLAASQWSLDEIAQGVPFRELLAELTVLCVLKSGGDYNAEYVRRLRDGVARHLSLPHRFVCLSDVPVPCERIPLKHGWPGWWSKLEVFRPEVITGPTLYLDLDTVIVGDLNPVASITYDFSMLNIRAKDIKVGNSGAMWFRQAFPHVYERFAEKPEYWIDYHVKHAHDRYMGDQAFISDCFTDIPKLHVALPGFFRSYKYDKCQEIVPSGCSVVCFGGKPRPAQAGGWVQWVWV